MSEDEARERDLIDASRQQREFFEKLNSSPLRPYQQEMLDFLIKNPNVRIRVGGRRFGKTLLLEEIERVYKEVGIPLHRSRGR